MSNPESHTPPNSPKPQEVSLYAARKKIHPRAVKGRFATWRWIFVWLTQAVFYGLCWLPWNGRQAVLFDIVERKFYMFGVVFWPQDLFYLAVLLIVSAYSLFLFTAVAGRLWCGYACPQTVYTEIFMWIERKIEGDRPARIKLDAEPLGVHKIGIRSAKYAAWVLFSFWTGFTFVGYFTPIKGLVADFVAGAPNFWHVFWMLFYGAFTYLFAGIMREQVCKYMCPYARFQSVMFDPDTLVITYDAQRGEPRAPHKKGEDLRAAGKGDCIDCSICVQVCPTGIDIRQGLQYECIGCGACVDACDEVMDKISLPRGLVRYTTENALAKRWSSRDILRHVMRPRIMIYSTVLTLIVCAAAWGIFTRQPIRMDVIKDRSIVSREVEDGQVENVYILQLTNMSDAPRTFELTVTGLEGLKIDGATRYEVGPTQNRSVILRARAPRGQISAGSHDIYFETHSAEQVTEKLREKTTFMVNN